MRATKTECCESTFPREARSHREKVLPPELEEIFEPRQLGLDEPEDDQTEIAHEH